MPPDIVVTAPEYERVGTVFPHTPLVRCHVCVPEEDVLAETIARTGARHAIVGSLVYRDRLYAALGPGSVLARFGVGYDGIDLAAASARGILCTNTPGVLDQSVAELAMLLIAAAARHVVALDASMRRGEWAPRGGAELAGRTLAIIGSGRIGAATARIAANGYGMRVIGCRRSARDLDDESSQTGFSQLTNRFEDAVRHADYVCLLIPGTAENAQFVNRERLAMLQPHAWLVNVARGSVVDEAALYDALSSGRLAGAALDVFAREPYVPADPSRDLRTLPNVVLVPHIGSNTAAANQRMSERAIRNVLLGESREFGEMDLLNPAVLIA
ncbi:MAG: NAD(P)-binding domain-containing protein [Acidobacteria bacterium]|nr:NAD(P)-binding domain-containing protein [Acidobacteriota bacterium]